MISRPASRAFVSLAAVRLDDADHDIVAVPLRALAVLQHLVGLADARRSADEDPELADALVLSPGGLEQGLRRGAHIKRGLLLRHESLWRTKNDALAYHRAASWSRARFSARTLTRGSPSTPNSRPSTLASTSWRTCCSGNCARLRHAGNLEQRRFRRNMRIEAAARRGHEVDRNGSRGVLLLELLHVALHALDKGLVGRPQVRAHGVRGVIGLRTSIWSRPPDRGRSSPRGGRGSSGRW